MAAAGYGAVIGRVDSGSEVREFGPGFDGMLMGGNAVIRRSVLTRVGPYRTDLGRTATRLMSCEDEDMFKRLLAAGARGFYRPDLIIHHYVAPERVAKGYFRRWCFWRGVSLGILDRQQPQDVAVPARCSALPLRQSGASSSATRVKWSRSRPDPARRFEHELAWWDLIGFVWGRHWERRPRFARVQHQPRCGPLSCDTAMSKPARVRAVTSSPCPSLHAAASSGTGARPSASSSATEAEVRHAVRIASLRGLTHETHTTPLVRGGDYRLSIYCPRPHPSAQAQMQDRLCDTELEDCRAPLLTLIQNETQGLDVAFWYMADARYSNLIVKKIQGGTARTRADGRAG